VTLAASGKRTLCVQKLKADKQQEIKFWIAGARVPAIG
jgi:hypothetical protein